MLFYPSVNVLSIAPAPLVLVVTLLPFGLLHLTLWTSLRFLHRRAPSTLYNPGGVFRWRLLWISGAAWLLLSALVDLVQFLLKPELYRFSFDPARFWPYFVLALLLLPLQTSAEELGFSRLPAPVDRAARAPHLAPAHRAGAPVWPAAHCQPGSRQLRLLAHHAAVYGIGLLLGWVTLRSQGLEMAFGLHLANNLYSGLVTGIPDGALPSATVFTLEKMDPMFNLIMFLVISLVFAAFTEWLLARGRAVVPPGLGLVLLAAVLLVGCAAPSVTPRQGASLFLEPCLLSSPGLPRQIDARCGVLTVPENPADPAGRQIDLNIAVIKAQSSNPAPDPLILLAGGPGQAATQAYLPILSTIERISFKRDLILVDQRGTGRSNPLGCAGTEDNQRPIGELPSPQETAAEFQACLKTMDADPRYYTTPYAMQDIDNARKALGYQQVEPAGGLLRHARRPHLYAPLPAKRAHRRAGRGRSPRLGHRRYPSVRTRRTPSI